MKQAQLKALWTCGVRMKREKRGCWYPISHPVPVPLCHVANEVWMQELEFTGRGFQSEIGVRPRTHDRSGQSVQNHRIEGRARAVLSACGSGRAGAGSRIGRMGCRRWLVAPTEPRVASPSAGPPSVECGRVCGCGCGCECGWLSWWSVCLACIKPWI